jgi:NAD(P)-dependent dehydrogenase (short-subunit alcohol dehydrogenase family)
MIMENTEARPTIMRGKIVLVTGSNSGIGKETAYQLARMGATVVMAVRNRESGEAAMKKIMEATGNKNVSILVADLSIMDGVRDLAKQFKEKHDKLDVLVNNAGGIFAHRIVTDDGFEMSLALNHLAPVLLIHELMDALKAGAPSRIVNVSSGAHAFGRVDLDDLQSTNYSSMRAYGGAKLMIIMATYLLSRKLKGTDITINVLHPGVVRTRFGQNDTGRFRRAFFRFFSLFAKSPEKGAKTSVYLASSPEVEGVSGKYFVNSREKESSKESYDVELQEEVWKKTLEMLGLEEAGFEGLLEQAQQADSHL